MSTTTERLHALVIERAELYMAHEFPHLIETDEEREARRARNEIRAVRIAETYAEAQRILTEHREETK